MIAPVRILLLIVFAIVLLLVVACDSRPPPCEPLPKIEVGQSMPDYLTKIIGLYGECAKGRGGVAPASPAPAYKPQG